MDRNSTLQQLAEAAPLPVAHAVGELIESLNSRRRNPRHALFDLCIVIESVLRFLSAVALAELSAQHQGRLPKAVAERLRPLIKAPTMGAWKEILLLLVQAQDFKSALLPEMDDFANALGGCSFAT